MNSLQVLSFLLVVGLSQSAPQQDVVSQVLAQLTPVISQTVGSVLGSRGQTAGFGQGARGAIRTTGFGQGATGAARSTGFGQVATGVVRRTNFGQGSTSGTRINNVGQGAIRRTNFGQGASSISGRGSAGSSGFSASQLTSNVVSSLQPAIAAAVAQALQGSQSRPSVTSSSGRGALTLTPEEEARINAQQSANAQYQFGYKVGDDETQTYMAHEETRNGENVEGKYNYVDATGALVTVTYQAGPDGYTENREVQEGAVQMRNIPGAWTGPQAGVSSSASSGSSASSSSSLSQSDLIAQILRAVQPQISSAVQSAIGSRSSASTGSFAAGGSSRLSSGNFQTASRRGSNSQSNLISTIIAALQPQISGAVQSALSRPQY